MYKRNCEQQGIEGTNCNRNGAAKENQRILSTSGKKNTMARPVALQKLLDAGPVADKNTKKASLRRTEKGAKEKD